MRLYFNEELHKYTDDLNRTYTSMTTVLGKYKPKFDKTYMAQACSRSKNPNNPYRGMSVKRILEIWEKDTTTACEKGTKKHDYLEQRIKTASGYKLVENTVFINDRIYTIADLDDNHNFGELDLDFFITTGIKERYPKIYKVIENFVNMGYRIYSELGVYDYNRVISGLIDIILIKDKSFVILDWKTNKDDLIPLNDPDLKWKSGYYKKDQNRKTTNEFVFTNELMLPPLTHMEASKLYVYALQLSGYSYMTELFGYTCKGIVLCHIREPLDGEKLERVDFYKIPYFKDDIIAMFDHHYINYTNKQLSLI